MKRKDSLLLKTKHILLGICIGVFLVSSTVSYANTLVSAWISDNITIYFDGEKKALPEGYEILVYEGRTYVPARFVAEGLGAEVNWNDMLRQVQITKPSNEENKRLKLENEKLDVEIEELKNKVKKLEEKIELAETEEKATDDRDYRTLPISRTSAEAKISLTMISLEDDVTTVYLNVENRSNAPIQLNQSSAELIVDGKTIKKTDLQNNRSPFDVRWYNDIKKDEELDGWIKFPAISEDTKKLSLRVNITRNDGSQTTTTYEFDAKL